MQDQSLLRTLSRTWALRSSSVFTAQRQAQGSRDVARKEARWTAARDNLPGPPCFDWGILTRGTPGCLRLSPGTLPSPSNTCCQAFSSWLGTASLCPRAFPRSWEWEHLCPHTRRDECLAFISSTPGRVIPRCGPGWASRCFLAHLAGCFPSAAHGPNLVPPLGETTCSRLCAWGAWGLYGRRRGLLCI